MRAAAPALLAFSLLVACGGEEPPRGPYVPGISGETGTGTLEVIAVDEASGELVHEIFASFAPLLPSHFRTARGWGWAVARDVPSPLQVHVNSYMMYGVGGCEWHGVTGSRVVCPIALVAEPREMELRIEALESLGAVEAHVIRVERPSIDRPIPSPPLVACELDAESACTVAVDVTRDPSFLVTALDADAHPFAFARHDVGDGSTIVLSSTELTTVDAPPLLAPPEGTPELVVEAWLEMHDGVALLPQSSDGHTLTVPVPRGEFEGAGVWLVVQARGVSARSVVWIRSSEGEPATWPGFLPLPRAQLDEHRVVRVLRIPEIEVYVVEDLDPIETQGAAPFALLLGASGGPVRARGGAHVRAVDAPGVSGASLALEDAPRHVTRFSEVTLTP